MILTDPFHYEIPGTTPGPEQLSGDARCTDIQWIISECAVTNGNHDGPRWRML